MARDVQILARDGFARVLGRELELPGELLTDEVLATVDSVVLFEVAMLIEDLADGMVDEDAFVNACRSVDALYALYASMLAV